MPSAVTRRVVQTADREEAESSISTTYEPTAIEAGTRGVFGFSLDAAVLETITAGRLNVLRTSRVFGRSESNQIHICVPLIGRVTCRGNTADPIMIAPGQASLWAPNEVPDTVWSAGTVQMCFMIPPEVLQAQLETILGRAIRRPLGMQPILDLRTNQGQSWLRIVTLLAAEFAANSDLVQNPVSRVHFERLLIDGLLLGHRHTYSEDLEEQSRGAAASAVARAADLIESDPASPWTVLELARQAHISVRALQEGFRRTYDTTPMCHLRDVRLRHVREELVAAPAEGTSVRDIAERWGFLHMGRFAEHYRRAYGELPSATLKGVPREAHPPPAGTH